jgi:hypothetical protein
MEVVTHDDKSVYAPAASNRGSTQVFLEPVTIKAKDRLCSLVSDRRTLMTRIRIRNEDTVLARFGRCDAVVAKAWLPDGAPLEPP